MAYASIQGRARVNPSAPEAAGVCDRCGFVYSRRSLNWQYDWRGAALQNVRILVCDDCMDTPQEQLRAIVVPADPVPIDQPRTQDFAQAETNYQTITQPPTIDPVTGIPIPGTTTLSAQNGQNLLTQPIGEPTGLDQSAVMPLEGTTHYRVRLYPLSVSSLGSDQISVTFSTPHGLSTNDQIVVEGLSNPDATGAYSITVTTATAFTYQTNVAIPAGALLTGTTLMVTANIGLPYGFDQIPQTGV
jgi:hypothetical protein